MEKIRLKPRGGRVFLFFVAMFVAILVPIAVGFLLGFLGPPPYLLHRDALTPEWTDGVTHRGEAAVTVTPCDSPEGARQAAREIFEGVPKRSYEQTLSVWRYVREDIDLSGLVLPVEEVVVQVEAPDEAAVDRALRQLPFVRENPEKNLLYVLLTEHLNEMLWGIGLYVVVLGFAMMRCAAWAARIEPPAAVVPISSDEMRSRLLHFNELEVPFQVRRGRWGKLIAEWRLADAAWTSLFQKAGLSKAHSVRMKLDPKRHRIRAVDVARSVRWSAGSAHVAWSGSFFRGISFASFESEAAYGLLLENGEWRIDRAYMYSFDLNELKRPLVEAVVTGGWTFQPVVSFCRALGG